MLVLAGCLIEKENKILMVQEAKEKCYGQWNMPSVHVEDNETIAKGLTYTLTSNNYEVTSVLNIKDAISNLNSSIDFIILDVTLPDGNGFDFYEKYILIFKIRYNFVRSF